MAESRRMRMKSRHPVRRIISWKYLVPIVAVSLVLIWIGGRSVETYLAVSESGRIPVLMYHRITDKNEETSRYSLFLEEFEDQLALLRRMKMKSVLPEDLLRAQLGNTTLPESSVMITFDDGTADHYSLALPVLEKYGFRAVFFVISGLVGRDAYLTEEQVRNMADRGMSIQSHTHTHRLLDQLDDEELTYELSESRQGLSRLTGYEIEFLCIPGGWYNERVLEIARATGYKSVYSSNVGVNSSKHVQYVLRRLEVRGNMKIREFARILSLRRIVGQRIERDVKIVAHTVLGSSTYYKLSHAYAGRMHYLYGGMALAFIFVLGTVALLHRRQR